MTGPLVRVQRLPGADPAIPLPLAATAGAAGLDIAANLAPGDRASGVTIAPGDRRAIPTGLAFEVPPGWEIQLRPRSGLALRDGITLLNAPGTIDCDYRGEVAVILVNHGRAAVTITHGMRIAQLVVAPVHAPRLMLADSLSATKRGAGGFGSTGA